MSILLLGEPHGATRRLAPAKRTHWVPVDRFCTGHGSTTRGPGFV